MTESNRRAGKAGEPSPALLSSDSKAGIYAMQPIAAAVVAALSPGAAAAQEEAQDLRIDEIIVTASKREVSSQDLGQSVTAIDTDDIERLSIQSMEDIVRALPGVSLSTAVPGRNSIVMRGLSTGTGEYYTDSQVAIYLDEQPITTISQQPSLRMVDIHHVESLPGPQGTLYGSSSQAGTIRYITNKPDPVSSSGEVAATYSTTRGGEGGYDLSGWFNLPLVDDRFAVRAVGYTSHDGGWIDNVLGTTLEGSEDNAAVVEEDYNEYDVTGGRLSARWIMNDRWELTASHIIESGESEGAWETDPAVGEFRHTKFFKEYRKDDWYQSSATITGDLGFAELTATASFFDRDIVYEWDNMVYEQWKDAYWGPYYPLYNSDYTFGTTFNDQTVTRDAYEMRLTSTTDSKFQWIIGGYYEDSLVHWYYGAKNPDYVGTTSWYTAQAYAYFAYYYYGYTNVVYPVPPTDIGYAETYDNTVKQKAVFGEMTYDLTDEWELKVGARWFEFDRDTVLKQEFPGGLAPWGTFGIDGTTTAKGNESDTIYKIATTYHFNDDIMAYALFSEGFRLGGENNARAAATGFVPATYAADKVENTEIGLKSAWLNGRILFNFTYFDLQWKDIQINQSGVDGYWWLRGTLNGGDGESKGFEFTSQWQATSNLYFAFSGTFSDPIYTEDVQRLNDVVPAGTQMVWAAKQKYNIWVDYQVPDSVLGGQMWVGYNHTYEGSRWNNLYNALNQNPEGRVPGGAVADAHVGLSYDNGWSLHLTARNVWDERFVTSQWQNSSGELFGDPRFDNQTVYTRPRTFSLTVRKRFE